MILMSVGWSFILPNFLKEMPKPSSTEPPVSTSSPSETEESSEFPTAGTESKSGAPSSSPTTSESAPSTAGTLSLEENVELAAGPYWQIEYYPDSEIEIFNQGGVNQFYWSDKNCRMRTFQGAFDSISNPGNDKDYSINVAPDLFKMFFEQETSSVADIDAESSTYDFTIASSETELNDKKITFKNLPIHLESPEGQLYGYLAYRGFSKMDGGLEVSMYCEVEKENVASQQQADDFIKEKLETLFPSDL